MKSNLLTIPLFAFICMGLNAQVTISVDPAVHYQTIEGWGDGGSLFSMLNYLVDPSIGDPLNRQTLDYLVDELGLTGSRTWEVGPRIDGTGMDDGNCDSINWSRFYVSPRDPVIAGYMVYFKNRITEQGFQPSFYSSPGYPTHATDQRPWVMNHPGERAQQIWADALWWKNNYGITINYDVIYNEPNISSTILADDIKALGPRLIARGLSTKTQYAEAVTPQADWNYITGEQNDTTMWPFVGRLSYHNYGNYNSPDPYRPLIRDFGISKGIPTAQTEMYDPSLDNLFSDLTLGGVSYWEVAYSGSLVLVPSPGNTSFTPGVRFFRNRQLLHYVRPGSVRIETHSTDSTVSVLSFMKNELVTTVILNNGTAQTVNLSGLPPGSYGRSQSAGSIPAELGIVTVGGSGTLTLNNMAGSGMATTLYPYSLPNHAPVIHTYGTNPGYIVSPVSAATLSVSANDAESDPLTYTWSVASQPPGANAVPATPGAASTVVSGMTVAGNYVFNIDVKDGVSTSSKKVYLVTYASNPSPWLWQPGFRIAAPYGLVFGNLPDTTHANIELPTSAVTLQVGISDLANSDFTGRGTWTLVSQPAGANAVVGSTIYIYISIRANVTGMTVPGDYVFQVNVTDPGHPDLTTRVICTVHAASSGPIIHSIAASPASITLPVSTTQLTATTSDPQGQLMRHWWAVKSIPAGAKPVFASQGLPASNLSGLTVPGVYTFTLRAFDDLHMTTKDVSVQVLAANGINNISSDNKEALVYPNPFSEELNVKLLFNHDKKLTLILTDSMGQNVLEKNVNEDKDGKITVNLVSLPPGIYYLTIQTKGEYSTSKILKNQIPLH
jgi:hypothetical protein